MKRAIELSPSEAIIHDGKKYRVDSVITEKNLSTIVSSSLTYPHKKVVFSTSPEVEFQTSPLETQSYLVRRRVGKTEFMLSEFSSHWNLGEQSSLCMRCIADNNIPIVTMNKSFGQTELGFFYCQPKTF